ncbi:hypothetical protein C1T30_43570, partial [Bacillus sp. MBGLi97]
SFVLIPLVNMVLRALGIGVMSYIGITLAINAAKDHLIAALGGMPIQVQQILGLANVDVAVNIVLSAVTTRFILNGVNKLSG